MAQDKTSTPVNSQKKAMGLYLAAKAAEAAERDFGKTYIEPLGPGEEITRPDNFLYEALSNPRLNRGLSNIGEAFIGEGTGSLAGDLLVGLTGGGAGVATELAGGKSGAVDWIPGGSVMKAGLLGLVKAGKAAEAKVIVDILQNPIANRFANRYPEEAIKSLQEFVKKHPSLKDMNTAEVYDVMQSGKLGDEYFVDLGKDYPEAMNIFGNTNSKMFTYDGKRMSLREILEANKNRYSENYTRPLEEMLDKVDELRERGDYVGAFLHSGVADQNIFAMLNVPPHMLPETTMESFRKKLLDAVPKKLPSDSRGDYIRSFGGKVDREADLINEYMHLQGDPIDWERIVDMDDRLAEDIANYGSIKAAEKAKQEEHNLAKKTALCEKVEAIVAEENKGSGDWERHTKQIIEVQAEWKTIGFAPQKMNVKIFERFRAACDDFFARKAEFFRGLKDSFKENADKKRALIEKAKALQDSTDWKSTSDKLIALQKEWKTIGAVPKKLGDQLWEEFLGACNKFFEARNAAGAGQRGEEHQNLEKKLDVIERLKAIAEETGDDLQERVQKLVEEYQSIGHVPFKEKDKLYEEYHAILDKLYKDLNISVAKRRLSKFKDNLKQVAGRGENALDNERARLMRQYEQLKAEVQTYENNLGFLNASSKKGNSLIDEMNRKVQKLKDEVQLVREKIKAIDAENRDKE